MECKICGNKNVYCKSKELCGACYQRERKKELCGPEINSSVTFKQRENKGEIEFIKNFFKGNSSWQYSPAVFRLSDGTKYIPDFYDEERNVFIEVSATRQAYSFNKHKYELFRQKFPKIVLEIRDPNGDDIEDAPSRTKWNYQLKAL